MANTLEEKTAESNPYHPTIQIFTLLFSVSHSMASIVSSSYQFGFFLIRTLDVSLVCCATSCSYELHSMQDAESIEYQLLQLPQHNVTLFFK